MTDEEFYNELWIYCYVRQIDGYPLGHPKRTNFKPIVPTNVTRKETLDMSYYDGFTAEQKEALK